MRIALLNQFYPPDAAPTGRYLHDLGRALAARGHEVRAFASMQGYDGSRASTAREHVDGVEVVRLGGGAYDRRRAGRRLRAHADYAARLGVALARRSHADVLVALTSPPMLGVLARAASVLTRVRVVHWVMDVYPDVLHADGLVRGGPYAILQRIARSAFRDAAAVVAIGPGMAARLSEYVPPEVPLETVALWAPVGLVPWDAAAPVPLRQARGFGDGTVLLYSGNFGRGHRFTEMLDATVRLGPRGPRWMFAGAGPGRVQIERHHALHPELPIEIADAVAPEIVREHLCSADVHLASLEPGWEGAMVPSKLQAAFAVGRPVVYVGRDAGDVAQWIAASGGGWVTAPGDVDGLVRAVHEAADRTEAQRRGARAHAFAQAQFSAEHNIARLVEIVERAAA